MRFADPATRQSRTVRSRQLSDKPKTIVIPTAAFFIAAEGSQSSLVVERQPVPRASLHKEDSGRSALAWPRLQRYQQLAAKSLKTNEAVTVESMDFRHGRTSGCHLPELLATLGSTIDLLGDPRLISETSGPRIVSH
jgi:hypothetical protein